MSQSFEKMKSFSVLSILAFSAMFWTRPAQAFDPFTIAMVASATVSTIQTISDGAGEVAGSLDAFGEFYSEVGGDGTVSDEGNRTIRMIREIQDLASEAGYTADEVAALTEQRDVKSLQNTLRALTKVVRAGKRALSLVMKLEKKAQNAQVEATEIERQQLSVQSQILETSRQADLSKKRDALREEMEKKKWLADRERYVQKNGGFQWGKIGIYSFPDKPKTLRVAIETAKSIAPFLLMFVLPLFLMRTVYNQVSFAPEEKYDAILRDTILCFFLMGIFPLIVDLTIGGSDALAQSINGKIQMNSVAPGTMPDTGTLHILRWLTYLWEFLKTGLFWLTQLLFNFGIAFYIALFPIVILLAKMQGTQLPMKVFVSTFVLLNLWPVFWHISGLLAVTLWDPKDLADQSSGTSVAFAILQFLSPYLVMKILHMVAPTEAAGSIIKSMGGAPAQVAGFMKGALAPGSQGGASGGRSLGGAARYGVTQGLGRLGAAAGRSIDAYSAQGGGGLGMLKAATAGAAMNSRVANPAPAGGGRLASALHTAGRFKDGLKSR
jgi:hypothetical protein